MSVKISELPILDSLADNDVIAGVDTSANVTSKIEMATLKNYIDTNTQYTAGTNIDITNNVVSAPNVYNKTETDGLIDNLETNINEQLEEKDEQIEELQSEVDSLSTIYNAFPTESGEGESLTLDDTAEVKFKKFNLKGNTSQTTYSGKNLIDSQFTTRTLNGVTITNNGDGTYTLNGTSSASSAFSLQSITGQESSHPLITNIKNNVDKYLTMSTGYSSNQGCYLQLNLSNQGGGSGQYGFVTSVYTYSNTLITSNESDIAYINFFIGIMAGASFNNLKIYPMITIQSSQITTAPTPSDFEPFVGGTASPNPSYPQLINVVSGDNEINVVGKNLYIAKNTNSTQGGLTYTVNDNGTFNISGTASSATYFTNDKNINEIGLINGNSYTLSSTITIPSGVEFKIELRSSSSAWLREYQIKNTTQTRTFTIDLTNAEIIRYVIQVNNGITPNLSNVGIQLEKGSSVTDFEPYQGNTYNINLGVKNLWNSEDMKSGYLPQSGSYPVTNSSYPDARYIIVPLYKGQSLTTYGDYAYGSFRMRYIDIETNQIVGTVAVGNNGGYCTSDVTYQGSFNNGTVTATKDILLGLFDFEGTLPTSGSYKITYGTKIQTITDNQIELCKIGNYQDYFGKSDGRNLFDKDNANYVNGWIDGTTMRLNTTNGNRMFYIPCKPKTTYTISRSVITSSFRTTTYDSTPFPTATGSNVDYTVGSVLKNDNGTTLTITTGANAKYLVVHYGKIEDTNLTKTLESIMIEKGSSASDYQPYGVGKWYLHKEIRKVVLNGSESGWSQYANANNLVYFGISLLPNKANGNNILANYFSKTTNIWGKTSYENGIQISGNNQDCLFITTDHLTIASFKTWLSANNVTTYYVLETPTTTEITYQPLIDQLNELEKAMSKDGQTNISQVNNDKPFILDVTAIKSLQSVLDRIELLES